MEAGVLITMCAKTRRAAVCEERHAIHRLLRAQPEVAELPFADHAFTTMVARHTLRSGVSGGWELMENRPGVWMAPWDEN